MTLRWLFATVHLLALGVGLGAVWARARALRGRLDPEGIRRVFYADNLWAIAAVLWLVTGLARAFAGLEKGTAYYLANPYFHAKLGLFVVILGLEVAPMIGLIRWRVAARRAAAIEVSKAATWATLSTVQAGLVVIIMALGVAIARGANP